MPSPLLFVAYKPPFISSNRFLNQIKKRYKVKKAGFSGTLDPFAKGVLIIAFGSYTKLFRFLKKTPKIYRATLWLGAKSKTLDIENIISVDNILPVNLEKIFNVLDSLKGEITYTPPLFSAKKIEGKRAYQLARENQEIKLNKVKSTIYHIKLLNYSHPFLTFEAEVSEGTYIRSIGEIIAQKLGTFGALSSLERIKEGKFIYENEKPLNPIEYLNTKENFTKIDKNLIKSGKKLKIDDLKIKEDGIYHLVFDDFFTIIEIKNRKVKYILNDIPLFR
ncbi:tRNA pseudouridine(55) synthase TruB [Nitrosophilus kaiyonis]|uniref:tRNA pseudouridine(55) synthase TruB n=1 Tax=Nitrosophilus kaiyonis TaxID=2930200 RepID=UPI0031F156BE